MRRVAVRGEDVGGQGGDLDHRVGNLLFGGGKIGPDQGGMGGDRFGHILSFAGARGRPASLWFDSEDQRDTNCVSAFAMPRPAKARNTGATMIAM